MAHNRILPAAKATPARTQAGRSALTTTPAKAADARWPPSGQRKEHHCVCPGFTATEMVTAISEEIQDQIRAKIPLGRFADPEEIAKAVRFLVVDGAYITGQQINVNGGIYM